MRVLIVDDTVGYRTQIKAALAKEPWIEVVGTAPNGKIALDKLKQSNVDLVVLDIEMPEMDGIETVREIKKNGYSRLKIIMFSGLSRSSAVMTLDALHAGANDVVAKPGAEITSVDEGFEYIRKQLLPKISQFREGSTPDDDLDANDASPVETTASIWPKKNLDALVPKIIVIASSTGGPQALEDLFTGIGSGCCPPILIAQHMPPTFTQMLAKRLNDRCQYQVSEGVNGAPIEKGHVYVAPGDYHMELVGHDNNKLAIRLHQGPKLNSVRPAADALFTTAAGCVGGHCLGIVLTGMGEDGLVGAKAIKDAGGGIFIQNRETCVVWGMPAAVYKAGAYDSIGDLRTCQSLLINLSNT